MWKGVQLPVYEVLFSMAESENIWQAGSGYLFDTHMLHRGMPRGPIDWQRTTVIAEYHEVSPQQFAW